MALKSSGERETVTPLVHLRSVIVGGWRSIAMAVLALAMLGIVVWAGITLWQDACHRVGAASGGPTDCLPFSQGGVSLIVALGFGIVGVGVWLAGQRGPTVLFLLLAAGTLATGLVSATGNDLGVRLFYVQLAWLAPLTLHFHLALLDRVPARAGRFALGLFHALATAWSVPLLFVTLSTLERRGWMAVLRPGVRLTFALAVVVSVGLLVWDYRRASPGARNRIRLVVFGTLAAFVPFLLLSLLPDTLGAPAHVPYEWTFPWLLISPLSYAYSLFRHRLTHLEVALNRAAVYYLLITLLLSLYMVAIALLNRLTTSLTSRWPLVSALLSVGLLLLFVPLYRGLQQLVLWVLYGGEISYAGVVPRLTHALATTLDRTTLQRLLVDELPSALRLSGGALFIRERVERLTLVGASGFETQDFAPDGLPAGGRLATYLEAQSEPVAGAQIRQALADAQLQAAERQLLARTDVAFWLPLVSSGTLHGLLLVGPKQTDEYFTAEDERILRTVAVQAGLAVHNVRLMDEVRAAQQALSRAHQQLLVGREQEQQRLAHELHDNAVQQLLGINYLLGDIRRRAGDGQVPAVDETRQELLKVVRQLRGQIRDLRPAGLEELGLTAALEGYVARLRREGGPDVPAIELDLDDDRLARLPEGAAVCLFRVAQEGLRNALKHARAERIQLTLRLHADEAVLRVQDDGCGFRVPARLSELAQRDHFGLVGMAERVSWAGGELTVRSEPEVGTELAVRVPIERRSRR